MKREEDFFETLTNSGDYTYSEAERIIECMCCGRDPETCGATEKDEDEDGFCKLYKEDDLK